ncbi:MAG TPA: flagellar biosynthesis protein FlhF [Steroidobacteraceae bacterium]|nr:flagellar biosynthesis protein FlhF [Steroidobacteraceae bacterium]
MKIKRYTATSMRAALALVRAEQGPDAVILSSRRGDDGIEVIAAVDYDEALFADAKRQSAAPAIAPPSSDTSPASVKIAQPAPAAAVTPAAPIAPAKPAVARPAPAAVNTPRPATAPATAVADPPAAPAPRAAPAQATARATPTNSGYSTMQRELQDMRRLLETGLAGITWNDKRLREPLKARVLEELTAMDIAPDVALSLAELTPSRTSLDNPSHIPLALLAKHLPILNDPTCIAGGITAVVGPTGAGKTTTIAKLAARWCMQHGSQDLALVSTDGYRIGAREQLMTYARILGAPMHAANGAKELARVLERLKAKKLILIDTAGMGPRDVRLTEQLAALKYGASRARVLLALPAQAEGQALDEIVCAFVRVKPAGCILTKVDEAASLGAALSTVLRHRLKIAYVCNGQRVPEDLHASHLKRIWLVREALELAQRSPSARDEAYFARNFGGVAAHA